MFSDFHFRVGKDILYAHQVFMMRCEYFRVLLASGMKESHQQEMVIEGFETSVILALLKWIYTDNISDVPVDTLVDLLQAANIYVTDPKLKEVCTSIITKEVDIENVAYVFMVSRFSNAVKLKNFCLAFIMQEFDAVGATEAFLNLTQDALEEILQFRNTKQ